MAMAFLQPVVPPTDADPALYNNQPPRQYQPAPLPPQVTQNFLQQVPLTYGQRMGVIEDLVGSKLGWDMADKQIQFGNQALQNPDLTDEQRKKITDGIDILTKQRDAFADYANTVRKTGSSLGLGDEFLAPYGNGKTLSEATQAYNNYATTAVRDLLATPSIDEQEQNRFMELWARGVSPAQAQRLVKFDHAKTQGDYERRIADGILTFGTNPNGSLNEVGLTLLNSAMNSSPKTAALFGNSYAMPKDIFTANNTRDLTVLGNTAAMERLAAQIAATQENAEAQRRATRDNLFATFEHQDKHQDKDIAFRTALAEIAAQTKGTNTSGSKAREEFQFLVDLCDGDVNAARDLYIGQKYSDAFKALRGDPKALQDKENFKTFVDGRFGNIQFCLEQKNYAKAKEMINEFRDFVSSSEFKYVEQMDMDAAKYINEQLQIYEEIADGKKTLQWLRENQKDQWRPGAAGKTRGEDMNAEENENAKHIGAEAAQKQQAQKVAGAFWNNFAPPPWARHGNNLYPIGSIYPW